MTHLVTLQCTHHSKPHNYITKPPGPPGTDFRTATKKETVVVIWWLYQIHSKIHPSHTGGHCAIVFHASVPTYELVRDIHPRNLYTKFQNDTIKTKTFIALTNPVSAAAAAAAV